MKTLKYLLFAVLALSTITACSGDNMSEQETDDSATEEGTDDTIYPVEIKPVLIGKGEITNLEGFIIPNRVITSVDEWNELKTSMRNRVNGFDTFDESDIDFSAYQVIALFDEIRPSNAWSIYITGIVEYSDKIVVSVTNLKPEGSYAVITQPYHIVRIPISAKEIVFVFQSGQEPFEDDTLFAPTGAEWYYTHTIAGRDKEQHCFNHIISERDTIVKRNSCRVVRQYPDDSNTASETYIIKQEQGKIYYYYQDRFNLLFDFDAEVNDTIEFAFMYEEYDNFPSPSHKDTILSARFKVENITINAQNLKTFRTKILDEDAHKLQGVYYFPYPYYIYTEKIGWHSEFMPMLDNAGHPDEEVYRWLRSYSDADYSFVLDDEWWKFIE